MKIKSELFFVRRKLFMCGLLLLCLTTPFQTVTFDCAFHFFDVDIIKVNSYTCFASVTASESTSVENVTGDHTSGNSNDDVEYFRLVNHLAAVFPKGLEKFLPNLVYLRFSNSGMVSISAEDLRPFPKIIYLYVGANKFTSLDADLFSYNTRLQWINIDRCEIKTMGRGLLANLDELTFVDFQYNPCVDVVASNRDEVLELMGKLPTWCPPECNCSPRNFKNPRPAKHFTLSVRRN